MMRAVLVCFAFAAAAIAVPEAHARRGDREQSAHAPAPSLSMDRAIEIARGQGLVRLHEAKFDDGVWEVEGWTADGRRIELDIHPHTGAILKQEFYPAAPKVTRK